MANKAADRRMNGGVKVKYVNGIWSAIVRLWTRLFGRHSKAEALPRRTRTDITPIETVGGKGHYFER